MEERIFEELVPSEERVAVKYAQGGTQRSVAKELGLSSGTVANHMRFIWLKLGVKNQMELRNLYDERMKLRQSV